MIVLGGSMPRDRRLRAAASLECHAAPRQRSRVHRVSGAVALVCAALTGGCYRSHVRATDAGPLPDGARTDAAVPAPRVWALVHPSDAPMGPGLYLYDEPSAAIVRRLPLPPGVTSPHALAWDGTSLWLSDVGDVAHPAIFELSPDDGSVRSRIDDVHTEGIGIAEDGLWCAVPGFPVLLLRVGRDGTPIQSFPTDATSVQDVTFANGAIYYLLNDEADRILRVDRATGATTELTRGIAIAPYSLGFDGRALAVAVEGQILRYDPTTGAPLSVRPFAVPGWITAIAFVR